MSRTFLVFLILPFSLFLAACGKSGAPAKFDASVPQQQQQLINGDFDLLNSTNLPLSNANDLKVVEVPDFQGSTLNNWFQTRVKLFVGDSFDPDTNATASQVPTSVVPQILQTADRLSATSDGSQIVTLALNVGSELYLQGRSSNEMYTLRTQDSSIPINSPRVGVVQLGQGLISTAIQGSPLNSMANSFLRLAVVFHEARHSDGNKANAGIPHKLCTTGDYAGNYACEANLNGPYAVQASLLRMFYSACVNCSQGELSAIQLDLADYLGRIDPQATFTDTRPEGYGGQ